MKHIRHITSVLIIALIAVLAAGTVVERLHGSDSAVALLAIGIFIGAIWANVSWGNYWSWDPKEVWAEFMRIKRLD